MGSEQTTITPLPRYPITPKLPYQAFRAFLKHHEQPRQDDARLKRQVYARPPADIAAYNEGKDAWIKAIGSVVLQRYRQQND